MAHTIEKLMSISRAEFEASLTAFDPDAHFDAADRATASAGGVTAIIHFDALPGIILGGLLAMPQARVRITLPACTGAQCAAFLRQFDIAFQRGGG